MNTKPLFPISATAAMLPLACLKPETVKLAAPWYAEQRMTPSMVEALGSMPRPPDLVVSTATFVQHWVFYSHGHTTVLELDREVLAPLRWRSILGISIFVAPVLERLLVATRWLACLELE